MESSQVKEVYMKSKDGACFKSQIKSTQASQVVGLTSQQLKIATQTVQQTDSILCQLIEKFNQYDMDGIVFHLSKKQCEKLLTAVRSDIKFKFDPGYENKTTYAYVYTTDKTHTVYLCHKFFEEKKNEKPLSKDSKIGTLIHEVSHFQDVVGTKDLSMDDYQKYLVQRQQDHREDYSYEIEQLRQRKKDLPLAAYEEAPTSLQTYDYEKSLDNAKNLEYEIELRYGHDGFYERSVWQCCNENKYVSICQIKSKYQNEGTWNNEKKELEFVHWGLYHCGETQMCKHNGYPYCTCEQSCKIKGWTCCRQEDFNDGNGCPKKYKNQKVGQWEDVQDLSEFHTNKTVHLKY